MTRGFEKICLNLKIKEMHYEFNRESAAFVRHFI